MKPRVGAVVALAISVVAVGTAPISSDAATASATPQPASDSRTLPPGYVDEVNHALSQKTDYWGDQLIAQSGGPTLQGVRDRLVPLNSAGKYLTDSGSYYLPLTMPRPDPNRWDQQRAFALHVADGNQLLSGQAQAAGVTTHSFETCDEAAQCTTFYVGADGTEAFGSAQGRSKLPRLADGYLPILQNDYTDASGVRYRRESFVTRAATAGPVVSMLHFRLDGSSTTQPGSAPTLRVRFDRPGAPKLVLRGNRLTDGTRTFLEFTGDATWNRPNLTIRPDRAHGDIYLAVPNTPTSSPVSLNRGQYVSQRAIVANYWRNVLRNGTHVHIPEAYVADAMRNVLLQNLVMAWRLSIGNAYEHQGDPDCAYIPEQTPAVSVLGDFGFRTDYRDNLKQLLSRGQGPAYFPTWEKGIKLQSAARYYELTGDKRLLLHNLATFQEYLADIHKQRQADPNGLLEKERTASDIGRPIYGLHSLTDVWRGLRDMGVALRLAGRGDAGSRFTAEATRLHGAIKHAVTAAKERLPDGSLYVPLSLRDPNADHAYDFITATRSGSYWNLLAPYAFATGFFPPHSQQAQDILKYLENHGSQLLGLPRFNYTGTPVGVCKTGYPAGIEGYKTHGLDGQYGYSMLKFLMQNGQGDRAALALYGKLGADMTPFTFISGEGTTVGACPRLGEYYRTMWLPPLAGNNATFLKALRLALVYERLDNGGMPTTLDVAPATPQTWLKPGKQVGVTELPTLFGPLTYHIRSHLDQGFVKATVIPPRPASGRAQAEDVVLHLRVPSKQTPRAVCVNGRDATAKMSGTEIHLGPVTKPTTVVAFYGPK